MRKAILLIIALITIQMAFSQTVNEVSWDKLQNREYPQWFKDAKLGIFVHWGLYSVPSWSTAERYAEWYYRWLDSSYQPVVDHHNKVWGDDFEYKDFAPLFTAELFDAQEWVDLFDRAGAKYIIFVSKHHDGFAMWPSKYSSGWNSVDAGPKRDIVGEVSSAVRNSGMKLGLYYSLTEWNNPLHKWYTDPDENITGYVDAHMVPQFKELVTNYRPELIFADGEWRNSADQFRSKELIDWFYDEIGSEAIVNNRWGSGSDIGFLTPEYSAGMKKSQRPWTECRGIGRSFGLNRNEGLDAYQTPKELIHFFVKAVANGGGITLNVGPKADGQIPLLQQERLLQLGKWLDVNGEAIYGCETYRKSGEIMTFKESRIDETIDFNWVRNTPAETIKEDNFYATWTGFIKPELTGRFTFEAKADDGVRVWIGNELLINKWPEDKKNAEGKLLELNTSQFTSGAKFMTAEKIYSIRVEYFEGKQNAEVQLIWSAEAKGLEKEVIPGKVLFTTDDDKAENGLNAEYRSKDYFLCYTRQQEDVYATLLHWPEARIALDLPDPGINGSVTLLGSEANLNWQYYNDKLIINTTNVRAHELKTDWAWTIKIDYE